MKAFSLALIAGKLFQYISICRELSSWHACIIAHFVQVLGYEAPVWFIIPSIFLILPPSFVHSWPVWIYVCPVESPCVVLFLLHNFFRWPLSSVFPLRSNFHPLSHTLHDALDSHVQYAQGGVQVPLLCSRRMNRLLVIIASQ